MSRITLTTIKSFIKKNPTIYIRNISNFDGMTDCVQRCEHDMFRAAERIEGHKNELGIKGAWFVFGSRDYFDAYETDRMTGYRVYNCCGSFILAIPKHQAAA